MKRRSCIQIADDVNAGHMPGVEKGCELIAMLHPHVRHCGDSHRAAWHIPSRRLLDYLLVFIADGHGRFVIDEVTYDAEPGDLFWIPPDVPHDMEGFPPAMHCPYVHFDLVYRPERSHWDFSIPGGMLDLSDLRPLLHEPVNHPLLDNLRGRIRGHTNRRIGQLIQDICSEALRAQPFAGLRVSGLMVEIIAEILRGQAGLPTEYMAHIPLLEQTATFMTRHCEQSLLMADLARQCELSISHFRSLFRRHFGVSPRAYLRRARIQKARELMVSSPLTLSEIAVRVGFDTVHSFSRAFREVEGLSPSYFRHCDLVRTRVEGRATPYVH